MPVPTPEHMQTVVQTYVDALNAGDLDAIMALYAEDAVVEDPIGAPPERGLAAIRHFYVESLRLQMRVELQGPIRAVANEAAFAFSVSVVHEGRPLTIWPIDTMRFDADGRIVHMRAFFGPNNVSPG